jgi:glucose-6-phosphate 1-dehydrogenase
MPDPCLMVIFGASGDLTQRKLVPALFDLSRSGALPEGFSVVGVGRTPMSDDAFRGHLLEGMRRFGKLDGLKNDEWERFASCLHYLTADSSDAGEYSRVKESLASLNAGRGIGGNILFYLATPPSMYEPIVRNLGTADLHAPRGSGAWVRIIIEKPFGIDLASARRLNAAVLSVFTEDQVYRIDHYLGKETVQNLLVFRFANGVFEPVWNRNYIDNIQITAAESVGIENRGSYYEEAGTLRDMVQNHLLQVLALTAMEPPVLFDARQVRDEKQKVFQALRPIPPEQVREYTVRGQYEAGIVDGKQVLPYRGEKDVSPESRTETFVALKLFIDNWRWADVPWFIRSGKRLPERATNIVVQFKRTPHLLFAGLDPGIAYNSIVIRIQPDEGFSLRFGTKVPGSSLHVQPVSMDFRYDTAFRGALVEAYTRLLLDCMLGDQTLYARGDSVDTAWTLITPILEAWKTDPASNVFPYPAGTWGPPQADLLLETDGRRWRSG